ncbi:MAG: hypothetical protein ACXQT6_02845 [Candidatus Methanospirareceae archaeon]|nr:MAG: hypothetical protein C4B55_00750 [Methanophagales archaeon]
MEAREVISSVVMVFSTFVLAYKWVYKYKAGDPVVVLSSVVLMGMLAVLFLSTAERLKRLEEELNEKERSLRVSMQSVEEEVREKVSAATRRLDEVREEIVRRGYR